MTGYVHPPGFDFPMVTVTADQLERAMAYIKLARPAEFRPIIKRSGLLTAGAANLIRDQMGGGRGAFVALGTIMAAMVRVAAKRLDIGRAGLHASLLDLGDLAVMNVKEEQRATKRDEVQRMAEMALIAFDLLTGAAERSPRPS